MEENKIIANEELAEVAEAANEVVSKPKFNVGKAVGIGVLTVLAGVLTAWVIKRIKGVKKTEMKSKEEETAEVEVDDDVMLFNDDGTPIER